MAEYRYRVVYRWRRFVTSRWFYDKLEARMFAYDVCGELQEVWQPARADVGRRG